MKLLADQSVNVGLVARLRLEGHDVTAIRECASGAPDEEVLQLANQEQRLLIAFDKDFGELVFRQGHPTTGVLLVRLSRKFGIDAATETVVSVLSNFRAKLTGAFSVVSQGSIRIRRI